MPMPSNLTMKALPQEAKGINAVERTATFVASTEAADRHGDIVRASGWELDHFKKNPVILYQHDHWYLPVGKALEIWVDGKELECTIQFPSEEEYEFGNQIFKLVEAGYINAVSVGCRVKDKAPILDQDSGNRIGWEWLKQELYEVSIVTMPANPQAVIEARAKGLISEETLCTLSQPMQAQRVADNQKTIKTLAERLDALEKSQPVPVEGELLEVNEGPGIVDLDERLSELENRTHGLIVTDHPLPLPDRVAALEAAARKAGEQPETPAPAGVEITVEQMEKALLRVVPDVVGKVVDERIKYHRGEL